MNKLIITLTVLLCSVMAFAENPYVFGGEVAQYNKISMDSNNYSTAMDGVTIGGDIFVNIRGNWYAEFGPYAQVGWRMNIDSGVKTAETFGSIKPSLGLSYRIPISDNGDISICPNAGFDIGAYLLGKSGSSKYKADWFKDLGYNRFILNWHTGAVLTFKKVTFTIRYEGYIVPLYNQNGVKSGLNQWSFGIGLLR